MNIFVESDVFLDVLLHREPHVKQSKMVLHWCEAKVVQGYTSPLVFSNVNYILERVTSKDKARKAIHFMADTVKVLPMMGACVEKALLNQSTDFEDALQMAAVEEQETIQVIITRNNKEYQSSKTMVMSPAEFIAQR